MAGGTAERKKAQVAMREDADMRKLIIGMRCRRESGEKTIMLSMRKRKRKDDVQVRVSYDDDAGGGDEERQSEREREREERKNQLRPDHLTASAAGGFFM